MGVRLTQRSTRRLSLTEAGRVFHEHCAAMLVEAEAAQQAVEPLRAAPSGTVRMTCPVAMAMAQFYVARIVAGFMREYPRVRIEIGSTDRVVNRIVNRIDERIDVALRVRYAGLEDRAWSLGASPRGALEAGTLVRVAPAWSTPEPDIHLVFPTRRGLLPAVRALIGHLVLTIPDALGG